MGKSSADTSDMIAVAYRVKTVIYRAIRIHCAQQGITVQAFITDAAVAKLKDDGDSMIKKMLRDGE